MRVVIVGAGLIGRKRAAALAPDDELIAVVDVVEERAQALAAEHGATPLGDIADALPLLSAGDLAIIATTHDQLVPAALPFARAGCHLLVEKPGARSAAEFKDLTQATAPGRVLAVGFNHRFHPGILRLKQVADEGRFGLVISVRARYGHGARPGYETEWRAQKELSGGGELVDQGSHLIDLTRFLTGGFALTHAELATLFWPMQVEDNAWLLGDLPGGGKASLHASWTEWKNLFSLEVFFTTAKAEVNGLGGSYGPETYIEQFMEAGYGPPTTSTEQFTGPDASWSGEWDDVKARVEAAESSRPAEALGATGDDAMAVLEVIAEAYQHAHH